MANGINRTVTGFSAKKDSKNVPTLEVNLSKGKAQIKKMITCGHVFLGREQKLHKKFPSVSHKHRRKIRMKGQGYFWYRRL